MNDICEALEQLEYEFSKMTVEEYENLVKRSVELADLIHPDEETAVKSP